ncbi:MAG: fibronectin type III domain-containing protein [Acidobacteriota bacterium]
MNKNGVVAVVVVVAAVILIGLWAMRSGDRVPLGANCTAPPSVPTGTSITKAGDVATLHWAAGPLEDAVTTYIIEAGSEPGANNQGTFVAPGTATSFQRQAPAGTYYVHMFARNACGTSAPTENIVVSIP